MQTPADFLLPCLSKTAAGWFPIVNKNLLWCSILLKQAPPCFRLFPCARTPSCWSLLPQVLLYETNFPCSNTTSVLLPIVTNSLLRLCSISFKQAPVCFLCFNNLLPIALCQPPFGFPWSKPFLGVLFQPSLPSLGFLLRPSLVGFFWLRKSLRRFPLASTGQAA